MHSFNKYDICYLIHILELDCTLHSVRMVDPSNSSMERLVDYSYSR